MRRGKGKSSRTVGLRGTRGRASTAAERRANAPPTLASQSFAMGLLCVINPGNSRLFTGHPISFPLAMPTLPFDPSRRREKAGAVLFYGKYTEACLAWFGPADGAFPRLRNMSHRKRGKLLISNGILFLPSKEFRSFSYGQLWRLGKIVPDRTLRQ
ncbi:hypothetical protein VTN00DRAFT_8625 [Thermoascus crustaceus]|uniref:uncharacterized protein n=1 Tax=Thermoascus crustaceus TaxID=5088 RepID=UPI0037447C4B